MKKEEIKVSKPFISSITYEQIWSFRPENPETYTGCEIVDAVMETIFALKEPTGKKIASHLCLPMVKLSYALEVCSGYNLSGILELLRIKRLRDTLLDNLDRPIDEIAHKAGFSNRSAVEKLLKNPKFARYFADLDLKTLRPNRYYKSKVGEKKVPYWRK